MSKDILVLAGLGLVFLTAGIFVLLEALKQARIKTQSKFVAVVFNLKGGALYFIGVALLVPVLSNLISLIY